MVQNRVFHLFHLLADVAGEIQRRWRAVVRVRDRWGAAAVPHSRVPWRRSRRHAFAGVCWLYAAGFMLYTAGFMLYAAGFMMYNAGFMLLYAAGCMAYAVWLDAVCELAVCCLHAYMLLLHSSRAAC